MLASLRRGGERVRPAIEPLRLPLQQHGAALRDRPPRPGVKAATPALSIAPVPARASAAARISSAWRSRSASSPSSSTSRLARTMASSWRRSAMSRARERLAARDTRVAAAEPRIETHITIR
jgi:hypothetical protein